MCVLYNLSSVLPVCACLHNHGLPPCRHCEYCSSRWESHNDICVQFLPCLLWSTEGTLWPPWPWPLTPVTNKVLLPVQHGLTLSAALLSPGPQQGHWICWDTNTHAHIRTHTHTHTNTHTHSVNVTVLVKAVSVLMCCWNECRLQLSSLVMLF